MLKRFDNTVSCVRAQGAIVVLTLLLAAGALPANAYGAGEESKKPGFELINIRKVTPDGTGAFGKPLWSPTNPDLIATYSYQEYGIFLINLADSSVRRISDEKIHLGFFWSNDGKYIITRSTIYKMRTGALVPGPAGVLIESIEIETGAVREIIPPMGGVISGYREVAPGLIAYRSINRRDKINETRLATLDGRAPPAKPPASARSFVFDDNYDIFVQVGNKVLNITKDEKRQVRSFPVLSPDGTKVLFYSGGGVIVSNLDGTHTIKIANASISRWHPDGIHIISTEEVLTDDGHALKSQDIYMYNIHTGERVRLTDTPNLHEGSPVISPDGKRLAFGEGAIYHGDLIRR